MHLTTSLVSVPEQCMMDSSWIQSRCLSMRSGSPTRNCPSHTTTVSVSRCLRTRMTHPHTMSTLHRWLTTITICSIRLFSGLSPMSSLRHPIWWQDHSTVQQIKRQVSTVSHVSSHPVKRSERHTRIHFSMMSSSQRTTFHHGAESTVISHQ